eukprot:gene9129-18910_t
MLHTSEIPIQSSLHGNKRRTQRDIMKRDLQAAVKYGLKERGFNRPKTGEPRWKYTFADVVYITDETSTNEITSWAVELPLPEVEIETRLETQCNEAKRRLNLNPELITSHTVVVVDMSGSMNESDMNGHRTRSRGVYYNLAEEMVAPRLHPIELLGSIFSGVSTTYTDVVTLIEMRDGATIVFEKEPVSWILYNKFVALAVNNGASSHGNYFPSIKLAFQILLQHSTNCALCLYFFSDGRPSDRKYSPYAADLGFPYNLYDVVGEGSALLKERLTFWSFGFGQAKGDFEVMKQMINIASTFGVKTQFSTSYHDPNVLASSLSSAATSLTATRTMLSCLDTNIISGAKTREKTVAAKETYLDDKNNDSSIDWRSFLPSSSFTIRRLVLEFVKVGYNYRAEWKPCAFLHPQAVGVAVSCNYFGEGAERIVYRMSEVDRFGQPVGEPLVAKESLYKQKRNDLEHLRKWHKTFVKIQMKSKSLANKFNAKLSLLGVGKHIPRIDFLDCCVYECDSTSVFLAERRLSPENYRKWNNNAGGVDGIKRYNLIQCEDLINDFQKIEIGYKTVKFPPLEKLAESEEEEDDDEEDDDAAEMRFFVNGEPVRHLAAPSTATQLLLDRVLEQDIPQAFSHFTHSHTSRDHLVCDLQGELKLVDGFPTFQLTDPCIHSRQQKYGRTDKGLKGFADFFHTHQCNAVCKLLKIDNNSYR